MNKRGVSPLISTLLLIAFAIALGAIVMNWGRNYIDETAASAGQASLVVACSDASIEIPIVDSKQKICNSTNEIRFVLYNNGEDIQGIKFTILGDKGVDNPLGLVDYPVERAKTISEKITYNPNNVGKIEQIKIIPKIMVEGKESFCTQSAVVIKNVNSC